MKTKFFRNVLISLGVLVLLIAGLALGGGFWSHNVTFQVTGGATSDTLETASQKDTSDVFKLQVQTGEGRGYDCATAIGIFVKTVELSASDSGTVLVYLEVSDDGLSWYPHTGTTTLAGTITSHGTNGQTTYWTVEITTFNEAKYGRLRYTGSTPNTDSVYVAESIVTCKY